MGAFPTVAPMVNDDRSAARLRALPSPTALLAAVAGVMTAAIVFTKGIRDPDYFWHLTVGRLIATSGSVPSTDPFSFTWSGQPWTAHEWLSELVLYQLTDVGGATASLIVFAAVAGAVPVILAWSLRRLGARPLAVGLVVALTVWVMAPYVTVRPQAVSWLMIALLIAGLVSLRAERPWQVLVLGPFFALWANLHGLWVVGLGVVVLYLLFTLIGRTPFAGQWRWMVLATAVAVLGTALTPAGPEGILYPLRYVDAGDWGLANIQEWQSPDFHDASHLGLLVLILALVATGGRGAPGWMVALSWIGVAMALAALRNSPVAAIVAAPALGLGLEHLLRHRDQARMRRELRPSVQLGRRIMEIAAAATIALVGIVIVVGQSGRSPDDDAYPVAATDRLLVVAPGARVVGEYGWGGYLISRLYDRGGRVFVDGRNDMYAQSILEEYSTVRDAGPGWEAIAAAHRADALLFPPTATIAKVASVGGEWCEAYRDAAQVLLLRECPSQ